MSGKLMRAVLFGGPKDGSEYAVDHHMGKDGEPSMWTLKFYERVFDPHPLKPLESDELTHKPGVIEHIYEWDGKIHSDGAEFFRYNYREPNA